MSTKHSKYFVNQKLEHVEDISFRELYGERQIKAVGPTVFHKKRMANVDKKKIPCARKGQILFC
jgi:hypothetical protein